MGAIIMTSVKYVEIVSNHWNRTQCFNNSTKALLTLITILKQELLAADSKTMVKNWRDSMRKRKIMVRISTGFRKLCYRSVTILFLLIQMCNTLTSTVSEVDPPTKYSSVIPCGFTINVFCYKTIPGNSISPCFLCFFYV